MAEPLSREQFALHLNIVVDRGTVDDEDYNAITVHDAALRQQLADVTQERDTLHLIMSNVSDTSTGLGRQLAESQATVARLREALRRSTIIFYPR